MLVAGWDPGRRRPSRARPSRRGQRSPRRQRYTRAPSARQPNCPPTRAPGAASRPQPPAQPRRGEVERGPAMAPSAGSQERGGAPPVNRGRNWGSAVLVAGWDPGRRRASRARPGRRVQRSCRCQRQPHAAARGSRTFRRTRGPRCSSSTPTSPSAAAGGAREGARPGPLSGVLREGRRPSGKPWPERGISGARCGVGPGSATSVTSTTRTSSPAFVSPSALHPKASACGSRTIGQQERQVQLVDTNVPSAGAGGVGNLAHTEVGDEVECRPCSSLIRRRGSGRLREGRRAGRWHRGR